MPYMTAEQIEAKMADLERMYTPVCIRFPLLNSVEQRPIHGLRIKGPLLVDYRPNVLITAGVHAREWAPPDALLSFIEELLVAYSNNSPIVEPLFTYFNRGILGGGTKTLDYGEYTVPALDVQNMVNNVVTYAIPMVNPDGRDFSLAVEAWWRKNRKSFNHWQLVKVLGATGGTYTLTFRGATTPPIAFNANAAQIERALELLTTVGPGNVVVEQPFPDPLDHAALVRFLGSVAAPYPLMIPDSTRLAGGAHRTVVVDWGDGVDINRNYNIGWKKEVYYSVAGERNVSGSASLDDPDAVQDYRGSAAQSEVETVNVVETIKIERVDYFLDLHLYAGKILLPWALEDWQSTNSKEWFGDKVWDRKPAGGGGRRPPPYKEWFPDNLWKEHNDLGTAMQNQIAVAAAPNPAESSYAVVEAGAGLYRCTGTGLDYDSSLQFLPDNREGTEKFAITFEAGDPDGFDGGFFPNLATGQYTKVARDIHGGIVGFLLKIVDWAAQGPLQPPPPQKH
jgi:hypothetical protein